MQIATVYYGRRYLTELQGAAGPVHLGAKLAADGADAEMGGAAGGGAGGADGGGYSASGSTGVGSSSSGGYQGSYQSS